MNKQIYLSAIIIMALLMSSCSATEIPESVASQMSTDTETYTRSSSTEDNILHFDNEAEFQSAVANLDQLYSTEEKMKWVNDKFPEFESIQDLYWEAMDEVSQSDDNSYESFEQFQKKYEGLYFPKFMEDVGFYIPMTNLNAAFLANRHCEVFIGGEIRNLRDIYNYDTLMEFGRAYYSIEKPMTCGEWVDFTLRSTSMDPVGPEKETEWSVYKGDQTNDETARKVKLKIRRKFVTIPTSPYTNGSQSRLHLELCFRKEKWYG